MFIGFPGRPDCDAAKPEFDGTCPRLELKRNSDPTIGVFLLLGTLATQLHALPNSGGLLDQDYRFFLALKETLIPGEKEKTIELKELLTRFKGFQR
jgi:hypothetical protein